MIGDVLIVVALVLCAAGLLYRADGALARQETDTTTSADATTEGR